MGGGGPRSRVEQFLGAVEATVPAPGGCTPATAVVAALRSPAVPVLFAPRTGRSEVAGTPLGVVRAARDTRRSLDAPPAS